MGRIETSISDANHVVLHAQNDRRGLGPIETINSSHNGAVVNAQWFPDLTNVFFVFKRAPLAPELQVSMGPSPHLWFCAFTTATL